MKVSIALIYVIIYFELKINDGIELIKYHIQLHVYILLGQRYFYKDSKKAIKRNFLVTFICNK